MKNLIILLSGFIPLILGANLLVDSASSLAKRFNIPNIVIGMTIIAFGTSFPELMVNIFSSINNNSSIALGNIVGSNIINILLILGISTLIYPLAVKTSTTWIEIPLCLLSALLMLILSNYDFFDHPSPPALTRCEGIILTGFFVIFALYNLKLLKSGNFEEEIKVRQYSLSLTMILLLSGFILLIVGGRIIVNSAERFAHDIGISQRIIALTIVSLGTSLPEIATSIVAAIKRNVDIAIGNVVGSNIFNAFFILGVSAIINPVELQKGSNLDLSLNLLASALLFLFIFTGRGRKLDRWEGIIFIIIYIAYIYLLIKP